ncbi:hypothetical protein [Lutispora thermophila]|jgi:small-conductance mechanosensitive channel|uniref:Uncharacterized protein n=1 Tax=Lutispora thermophila DSM 19022 TaxID=1122184 RepID=A0A1M6HJK5_9FIRM|nr:hypothetical protein [Lutispora thermophila]NLV87736.1 hypothetical protein [Tissierellia bacterium]SHJ22344.1 hypothetical protein SAMN02745176_02822 [Lutispora thermophila DSM 19022]
MKKSMNIIFNLVIPTAVAYIVFFLLYYFYKKMFYEYRLLAIIPFLIVTMYLMIDNIREWRMIKQQG